MRPSLPSQCYTIDEMPLKKTPPRPRRSFALWKRIGPGFITGAADDDPSGIATYAQTGVRFGYGQLWTALFSFPFMTAIQEMCGRIGLVTGNGLAGVIRKHYAKSTLTIIIFLLFFTNSINIGADLGAMASSAQLFLPLPFFVWLVGLTIISLALQVFVSYPKYALFLKYLTLSLFGYFFAALVVAQPWKEILISTLIPTVQFSREYLFNITAILGTTISPYLFFWQADEEVEEEIEHHKLNAIGIGKPIVTKNDLRTLRTDTILGMLFSNSVMLFIMISAATTLRAHGITHIETASQAAEALRPLVGNLATLLFATGILGTGLLAVPILAGSAAGAIAETVSWKSGLNLTLHQARGYYGIIILSTLLGFAVNFLHIPPFKLLYYTAILSGVISPPLLIMIMRISNNPQIMGRHTNTPLSNVLGWTITVVMSLVSLTLLVSFL